MDNQTTQNGYSGGFSFGGSGQSFTGQDPASQQQQGGNQQAGNQQGAVQQAGAQVPPPTPYYDYGQAPVQTPPSAPAPMQPLYNQPTGTQAIYDYPASNMPAAMPGMPGPAQGGAYSGGTAAAPLAGMGDPYGGVNPAPFDPNYRFADRMKNWSTTVKIPTHPLKFDEAYFLNLLAGSISLTRDEKKKIVDSIPKLRQEQIDELIRIFEEERSKFIELSAKHGAQLKKLEDEHASDWRDIELSYLAETQKQEEDEKAAAIRKQLGLN